MSHAGTVPKRASHTLRFSTNALSVCRSRWSTRLLGGRQGGPHPCREAVICCRASVFAKLGRKTPGLVAGAAGDGGDVEQRPRSLRERETVSMMRPGTIILFHFKYFVSRWTISLYNKVSLPRFLITKHDDEGEGFYRQSLTGERFARQAKSIATHLVGGVRIHSSCHFFFFLSFFSIRILFSLHLISHVHLFFIITYITNYFIRSWLLFSFLSCSWVHWGYSWTLTSNLHNSRVTLSFFTIRLM